MKVKLCNGRHKNARKFIDEIIGIYNDTYEGAGESFSNDYPDKCIIARVAGVKGGVILEKIYGKLGIIFFAGFEESERGKGHLKACLIALQASHKVYGVQVNPFDNYAVWQKLGFVNEGMINYTVTLLNVDREYFNQLATRLAEK